MKKTICASFYLIIIFFINTLSLNIFAQSSVPNPDMWVTNGDVHTICIDSNYTYIGGSFTYVGPNTGSGAKLTDTSALPALNFPSVNDIILQSIPDGSGGWYVVGSFTKVGSYVRNHIVHILEDGTVDDNWNPNPNGDVSSIAISENGIYVGGAFTSIGGQARNHIAKLNNTNGNADEDWNPNSNGDIGSIAVNGSYVYAIGSFTSIGGQDRKYIAKLNNTSGRVDENWNPNVSPDDNFTSVRTITVSENDIYVGGFFTSIGGQARNCIAKLNNTNGNADENWNPNLVFSAYTGGYIQTITVSGNDIYVGGSFTASIGGQARNNIAKLNNTNGSADENWNPSANGVVSTITVNGNDIYVGGWFTSIGGQARNYIAKLNNTNGSADINWNPLASGYTDYSWINNIAISGSDIYVGGAYITSYGGRIRNNIARLINTRGSVDDIWDPNSNGQVNTLVVSGSDVYVGGWFTTIGGQSRNSIAKLNKTNGSADKNWNPNCNGTVNTIAVSGRDIYVGGRFYSIGGQIGGSIVKLNKTNSSADKNWNPNCKGDINTIAVSGSNIYVGGSFYSIGGLLRKHIAKLDTNGNADENWNPNAYDSAYIGAAYINTITVSGSDIYVGGLFSSIGSQARNSIAKLNNTNGNANELWNPNVTYAREVDAITINGSDIYVGGSFDSIGGQARNYIAKLNDTNGDADENWNPELNFSNISVVTNTVYTIAVSGSDIYAGGSFTLMGGDLQPYFALFTDRVLPVEYETFNAQDQFSISQNYPNPFNPVTTINYSIPKPGLVVIKVFDSLGREITTLVNEEKDFGDHQVKFNASNLASGVYFYQIKTGNNFKTNKMILLR